MCPLTFWRPSFTLASERTLSMHAPLKVVHNLTEANCVSEHIWWSGSGVGSDENDPYLNQAVGWRWTQLHENSQPSYSQRISKQMSSSQVLRVLALERSWSATTQLARSIIIGYDHRTLENAADEVGKKTSSVSPQFYQTRLFLVRFEGKVGCWQKYCS